MAYRPIARIVFLLFFFIHSGCLPAIAGSADGDSESSFTLANCMQTDPAKFAGCIATNLYAIPQGSQDRGYYDIFFDSSNCHVDLVGPPTPVKTRICKAFGIPLSTNAFARQEFITLRSAVCASMKPTSIYLSGDCPFACQTGPALTQCFVEFTRMFSDASAATSNIFGTFSSFAHLLENIDDAQPASLTDLSLNQDAFVENVKMLALLLSANLVLGVVYAANMSVKVRIIFGTISLLMFLFDGAYVQVGIVVILLLTSLGASVYSPSERSGFGIAIGVTVVCCFTAAMQHPLISMAVGIVSVVVLALYVYASLATRPRVEIVLYMWGALTVANLWTAYGRVLGRAERADPVVAICFYVIRAALPYTAMMRVGKRFFVLASVWEARRSSVVISTVWRIDQAALFVSLYFGRFILFYLFRTILGFSVVRRVQGLDWLEVAARSFIVPVIDVFAPFHAIVALVSGRSMRRQFAFELVNSVFVISSILYAIDMYVIHCLLALIIAVAFPSIMRTNRVLLVDDVTITASGFAQIGALPWMDVAAKEMISKAVHVVTTTAGNGVCFLQSLGANTYLRTVDHVLSDSESVTIGDETLTVGDVKKAGGSDPAVSAFIDNTSHPTAEIQDLTRDEIKSVALLWTFSPRLLGGGAETFIDNFKFDTVANTISAAVNLTFGDSGTPVFAVLRNGCFRLAGFVSRGSRDTGSGNFIASVFGHGMKRGSPGLGAGTVTRDLTVYSPRLVETFSKMNAEIAALVRDEKNADRARVGPGQKKNAGDRKRAARRSALRERLETVLPLVTTHIPDILRVFDEKRIIAFNVTRAQNQTGYSFDYVFDESKGDESTPSTAVEGFVPTTST